MEKIFVFTDSTSDIPQKYVEATQLEILPIRVTHEGRSFREYYDTTPEQYWRLLREAKEIPQTSQVTPAEYLACYRKAHDAGYTHVLGITMNAKGSGGHQSALIARELFYDEYGQDMRIEVLDSETYTMIYGRVVLKACELRDHGDSFDAIVAVAKSRIKRCEAVLGTYSLKHLKKSGRISGGAAFIGEALGLKPLSHVYAGAVTVCDKARGEKNLVPRMVEFAKKRAVGIENQTAGLLYADISADKIDEAERLLYEAGFKKVERWPIGVAVTTNTGPEAIAVMYYGAPRED